MISRALARSHASPLCFPVPSARTLASAFVLRLDERDTGATSRTRAYRTDACVNSESPLTFICMGNSATYSILTAPARLFTPVVMATRAIALQSGMVSRRPSKDVTHHDHLYLLHCSSQAVACAGETSQVMIHHLWRNIAEHGNIHSEEEPRSNDACTVLA